MIDKELIAYIKGKRHLLVLIVICSFLGLCASVSSTYFLARSIEIFMTEGDTISYSYLFGTLLLALCFAMLQYLRGWISNQLADYVSVKIRKDIFGKYVALGGRSRLRVQEVAQLTSEGVEQLRLYYSSYLPSFFYSMIAPISLFVLFCFFSYKVALVYLVCVPLIPISIILVSKWAKKIFATYWDRYLSLGGAYLDAVSGMKELLIFNYDRTKENEMKKNSEKFRRITMKVLVMQLCSTTIMDFVAYGGAAVGITITLIEQINHTAGYSPYLALFLILVGAEFFLPLRSLGSSFHIAMNGATAGRKVIQLLKENEEEKRNENLSSITEITLKDVSFRYADAEEDQLHAISMRLTKGFHSLLGDSGCGKSTLAKIMTKQLTGYQGSIQIDGKELSDIDPKEYRKKVCYLSVDTFLLHRSVREAFLFYAPDITEERMMELLALTGMKERILESGGLDYLPREGASDLSGGEKQRLVLSYYLSAEKDFFVFDETTSNIDRESEEIIVGTIEALSRDHIVLFISHRLRNALHADDVLLLNGNGALMEEGTPEQLLRKEGSFKKGVEQEKKWEEIL